MRLNNPIFWKISAQEISEKNSRMPRTPRATHPVCSRMSKMLPTRNADAREVMSVPLRINEISVTKISVADDTRRSKERIKPINTQSNAHVRFCRARHLRRTVSVDTLQRPDKLSQRMILSLTLSAGLFSPRSAAILSEATDPLSIVASCLPTLRVLRASSVTSALIFLFSLHAAS